jgi:hypothetical protein
MEKGEILFRFPVRTGGFSFLQGLESNSGTQAASKCMGTGASSSGGKGNGA